jgi:surfeit locus 1 family protein
VRLGRREVGFAVAAAAVAIACVAAGIWQLDRLRQRHARNSIVAARLARPPLPVGRGTAPDSVRQRRLVARGVYDFARERVWPLRSFDGTPGVALVTPLRLADGSAVFIDRGWVPSPDAHHVDPALYREADTATVEGLGMIPPRGHFDVDIAALRDSVPYALLPFILQETGVAAPRGLPRRWPPPALDDGPHLSYAIQWFSFAVIIVVGTGALLRKTTILGPS